MLSATLVHNKKLEEFKELSNFCDVQDTRDPKSEPLEVYNPDFNETFYTYRLHK